MLFFNHHLFYMRFNRHRKEFKKSAVICAYQITFF